MDLELKNQYPLTSAVNLFIDLGQPGRDCVAFAGIRDFGGRRLPKNLLLVQCVDTTWMLVGST